MRKEETFVHTYMAAESSAVLPLHMAAQTLLQIAIAVLRPNVQVAPAGVDRSGSGCQRLFG